MRALEDVLRISSGVKNVVIVVIAAYFAGAETHTAAIILVSFSLTCITSAMYAYNALTDVKIDAKNPNKQHRSRAARTLPESTVHALIFILITTGALLSVTLSILSALAHVLLATELFLYSSPLTRFKERPLLDVVFGAVLSFSFRYFGAWYALSTGAPPLWPLAALVLAKCGGFMLYKELDRKTLEGASVQNSITLLPPAATTTLALISVAAAVAVVQFAAPGLASFLPLAAPPLAIILAQRFRVITVRQCFLRSAGLLYFLTIAAILWYIS